MTNKPTISRCRHAVRRYAVRYVMAFTGLFAACGEFIEPSLTDEVPELLSPGDRAETVDYELQFLWEPMDDALQYRLQIATPSFDSVRFFLADTLLPGTKYTHSVAPGAYEWRLRAQNGSSTTAYVTRSFTVHSGDLSKQRVLLGRPAHMAQTNRSAVTFSWQSLFGAAEYTLQVDTNNFAEETEVVGEETTVANELAYTLPKEGRYQWRVRGSNDTVQTAWSEARVVNYDATPPTVPAPVAPENNQSVAQPVRLVWENNPDAVRFLVYVYKSDSTRYDQRPFPVTVTDSTYVFEGGKRQEAILWRVKAVDQAGNASDFSAWRRFVLNN